MSKHVVEVVEVKLEPHPNADSLSIVRVPGTDFSVCARSVDWRDGALGAYVEPDMVVPDTADYAWLCSHKGDHAYACGRCRRIRAKRLRGVWSMGLLVPAPDGAAVGDNVIERMGIERYEPPVETTKGSLGMGTCLPHRPPPGIDHIYDIENGRRYPDVIEPDEPVTVTEKIHGTNARFTWRDSQMWAGSHRRWLKEEDNLWWRALAKYPQIKELCQLYPDYTLYGEIYGSQDLRYGLAAGDLGFAAFDLLTPEGRWISAVNFKIITNGTCVPTVPVLYSGPYFPGLKDLADGQSTLCPDQIREGVVIKPDVDRWNATIGRVIVKYVSNQYLERAK